MRATIVDGLAVGLRFGLLAAGLTLVYGLGGVLNLAYGQMAVVSAMVVLFGIDAGVGVLPAIGMGLVAGAVLGLIFDLTLLRPVYRRQGESRVLLSLLLSLGAAFMVDGYLSWRYPFRSLSIQIAGGPMNIVGVRLGRGVVVASGITIVVLALLFVLFRFTALGRAIRSVIEDEQGAQLVGISPRRMLRFMLILSGVLAAIVAVTQAMVRPVTVTAGFELTVFALIVTVVGGLGSFAGAFLGGLGLGIIWSFAASHIGSFLSLVILLGAAAITILIRPSGLLGVKE
ncbi:MAG TPA: branched-chain amino acid ABC transporter permease [Gemmatimonadales bacterium]|nr:branched-chain amino acid ABC transporter permease [Gemmatimonadales bacterium]